MEAWNSEDALKLRKEVSSGLDNVKDTVSQKATELWNSEDAMRLREGIISSIDCVKETSLDVAQKASDVWNNENVIKFRGKSQKALKVISGIQAVEDRKKSIQTREEADLLKAEIESTNEAIREDLNETLEDFGRYRLESLKESVGRFLHCLEQMNQKAKGKEYEFLNAIDIKTEEVKEMATIEMSASDALRTLAVGGGFAAAEESIFLTKFAKQVTVLVRGEDFTCAKSIADEVKNPKSLITSIEQIVNDNYDTITNNGIKSLTNHETVIFIIEN